MKLLLNIQNIACRHYPETLASIGLLVERTLELIDWSESTPMDSPNHAFVNQMPLSIWTSIFRTVYIPVLKSANIDIAPIPTTPVKVFWDLQLKIGPKTSMLPVSILPNGSKLLILTYAFPTMHLGCKTAPISCRGHMTRRLNYTSSMLENEKLFAVTLRPSIPLLPLLSPLISM
jgi:hypothetical protein